MAGCSSCEAKKKAQLAAIKSKMKNIELKTNFGDTEYKLTPPKDK